MFVLFKYFSYYYLSFCLFISYFYILYIMFTSSIGDGVRVKGPLTSLEKRDLRVCVCVMCSIIGKSF